MIWPLRVAVLGALALAVAFVAAHAREPLRLNVGDAWGDAELVAATAAAGRPPDDLREAGAPTPGGDRYVVARPLPASALSPELLARYLERWAGARSYLLREGFFLVKTVALLGWGAHPAVRARYAMPAVAASPGTPPAPPARSEAA